MSLVIRDARIDDADVITKFNYQLADETEDHQLDRKQLARGVRRALTSPQMCRYFVAEVGGEVVGQTMLTYELTDWRDGVLWWIQSVYVRADHRGQGVFKALHGHIAQLAAQAPDSRGLRLYVHDTNHAAQRTYDKLGFTRSAYRIHEILDA